MHFYSFINGFVLFSTDIVSSNQVKLFPMESISFSGNANFVIFLGTTTDGEFCSLRSRGETRALHIWQIIHDVKDSVWRKSKATLLKMLIATNCK